MFVCLEGIDGAGKTSTAAALHRQLAASGHDPVLISKASVHLDHPETIRRFEAIGRAVWTPGLDSRVRELGDLSWVLYNAAYYAALAHLLVRPALRAGRCVVIDGWYYKFVLRAAAVGELSRAQALTLFGDVLVPDSVFLLDLAPAVAAARMGAFTENETGNGTQTGVADAVAFVAFQEHVRSGLLDMAETDGWTVLDCSRDRPDHLAGRISRILEIHQGPGTRER
jgi:thymidylate kinase